jgi:hypothetical protein
MAGRVKKRNRVVYSEKYKKGTVMNDPDRVRAALATPGCLTEVLEAGTYEDRTEYFVLKFNNVDPDKLEESLGKLRRPPEYLREVKRRNLLDDLEAIQRHAAVLHRVLSDKDSALDDELKEGVLRLREASGGLYDREMDKELRRQKKAGKQFLSNEEIDRIVEEAMRDAK